jgi:hypothetical protein
MFKSFLVIALLGVAPLSGQAWGVLGHRTIGRIAENHLTPKAKREIAALLGTETLPLVSTFADEITSAPSTPSRSPMPTWRCARCSSN